MKRTRIIKTIKIDADKCTGCRACEVICAAYHAEPKYSIVNPARSRIQVFRCELDDLYVPIGSDSSKSDTAVIAACKDGNPSENLEIRISQTLNWSDGTPFGSLSASEVGECPSEGLVIIANTTATVNLTNFYFMLGCPNCNENNSYKIPKTNSTVGKWFETNNSFQNIVIDTIRLTIERDDSGKLKTPLEIYRHAGDMFFFRAEFIALVKKRFKEMREEIIALESRKIKRPII